jgi:hypothetical protein
MDVSIIQPVREAFRDGQFVSKKIKSAPRGLFPGAAAGPGTGRWRVAGAAGCGGGGVRGHGGARGRAETEFGINGGSSGKDGGITLGDHTLVFSELRRVTCGVVVHKAVDNRCDMRTTGGILWTRCGQEKNLK